MHSRLIGNITKLPGITVFCFFQHVSNEVILSSWNNYRYVDLQLDKLFVFRSTKVWPSEVERRKGNDGDNAALQTGEKGGHHIWVCIFYILEKLCFWLSFFNLDIDLIWKQLSTHNEFQILIIS